MNTEKDRALALFYDGGQAPVISDQRVGHDNAHNNLR